MSAERYYGAGNRKDWKVAQKYELCGIVLRPVSNNSREGHFMCVVRNTKKKNGVQWSVFDDEREILEIEKGRQPDFVQNTPVVAIFRKVKAQGG